MNYTQFLGAMGLTDSPESKTKYDTFRSVEKPVVNDITALKEAESKIPVPETLEEKIARTNNQMNKGYSDMDNSIKPVVVKDDVKGAEERNVLGGIINRTNELTSKGYEDMDNSDFNPYAAGADGARGPQEVDAVTSAGINPMLDDDRNPIDLSAYGDDRKDFWDKLYENKDGLDTVGIPMYGYGSDKASEEDLEKLIAQNPMWYEEFKKTGNISMPNPKPVEETPAKEGENPLGENPIEKQEELLAKEIVPENLEGKEAAEPVIETQEDTEIAEAIPETWKDKDGNINWDFIGKVAKETGQSVMGLFESAIMGYLAAKQGRALGQEETQAGRNRIKEEQERLMNQQEEQNVAGDERQFEIARKLSEIGAVQDQVARKFQVDRDEADKLFEVDRDADAHKNRMEEIAAQEEAATQRLWAAASIQKTQNQAARALEDPLSVRTGEISMSNVGE